VVTLADGNEWLVPVARAFAQGVRLPAAMRLGPNGEILYEILPRYMGFAARVERFWAEFFEALSAEPAAAGASGREPSGSITERELFDLAVEALGLNYLLGQWEVSHLGLLSTLALPIVLRAIIDVPTVERVMRERGAAAAQKKSTEECAGSST